MGGTGHGWAAVDGDSQSRAGHSFLFPLGGTSLYCRCKVPVLARFVSMLARQLSRSVGVDPIRSVNVN